MRRSTFAALACLCLAGLMVPSLPSAESARQEAAEHPRIAKAIREVEEAIRYLEAAPHDFGGHKEAAIRASREAVVQMRLALKYRAVQDTKKGR